MILTSLLLLAMTNASPVISGGEVKILYPCSVLADLPHEKEEKEVIHLFEMGQRGLSDKGLIFRQRGEEDFTVKYRSTDRILVQESIYHSLSLSRQGELKCEVDVTYDPQKPKSINSCSFKASQKDFIQEHFDFIEMVNVTLPGFNGDLSPLRKVRIESSSWKLRLTKEEQQRSPLSKKPSIEKWTFRNECLLEVSGKFEATTNIEMKAAEAMKFIQKLVPAEPDRLQGNKTNRALGI